MGKILIDLNPIRIWSGLIEPSEFETFFLVERYDKKIVKNCRNGYDAENRITEKGLFLRPSELNGRSLRAVEQCQNFLGATIRMWETFSFFFSATAFIVCYLFCL